MSAQSVPAIRDLVLDSPHPSEYSLGPAKRAFDIAVGVALCIVTAPLIMALAVGSAVRFGCWPFFTQDRLGLGERRFRLVKLRSLPKRTPKYADKYELGTFPTCRWGAFLRSKHLDELPQLWLVVTGRMSLVGPRPEMRRVASRFSPEFVRLRTSVRPGCTGPWQVGPDACGLIGEAPMYDAFYVAEASLRLDIRVLIGTALQMLGGRYLTLERLPVRRSPSWQTASRPAIEPVQHQREPSEANRRW